MVIPNNAKDEAYPFGIATNPGKPGWNAGRV